MQAPLAGLEDWERGVLASRVLFIAGVVFALSGWLLATGMLRQSLFGVAAVSLIGGFVTGYRAQRAYLAAGEPTPGGDN